MGNTNSGKGPSKGPRAKKSSKKPKRRRYQEPIDINVQRRINASLFGSPLM
ncbi:hypothetical protein BNJ_00194 [Kaumoebavirus]|uniref:hypothetical protein n=1 Tax=Kaumoebavirus TaxID=1859492 RepID=UPI0009C31D7E|nr:hypothetical protein BNJ_00194 [Kaumoebavirus]ARA72025.1 hypothetical protein BNJ_00194 [Kaumoebavirus]